MNIITGDAPRKCHQQESETSCPSYGVFGNVLRKQFGSKFAILIGENLPDIWGEATKCDNENEDDETVTGVANLGNGVFAHSPCNCSSSLLAILL